MKSLPLILILASAMYCFGQNKSAKRQKKYAMSEIKKSFPYNKMKSIKLVSFKYVHPQPDTLVLRPSSTYEPEIPKTNGAIDLTKMFEVKAIDSVAEEKLLNILMNHYVEDENVVVFCYEPRNGIVFFDENDNVIGYIEICFECLKYKAVPDTISVTALYPKEYGAIKRVFEEEGITYGTVHNQD